MKKLAILFLSLLIALLCCLPLAAGAEASVSLNETKLTFYMVKGEKTPVQTLKATVSGGKNSKLTWSSSDTSVAKVGKDGKVTPVDAGQCVITCTLKKGNGASASCQVTVTKAAVTKIKLNKSKLTLKMTDSNAHPTATLKATVSPSKAWNPKVKWKSSDTSVVTVNSKGEVKAKGKGTATVTCTSSANPEISATCKVTVKDNRTPTLKVSKTHITLKVGETKTLDVTFNKKGTVTWHTDDSNIASPEWIFKWDGNKTKLKITGKSRGTTYVRITNSVDDATVVITVDVIPNEPTVGGWTLSDLESVDDPFGMGIKYIGYALDVLNFNSSNYSAVSYMRTAYNYMLKAKNAAAALPAIYSDSGESMTGMFNDMLGYFERWNGSYSGFDILEAIEGINTCCMKINNFMGSILIQFPH